MASTSVNPKVKIKYTLGQAFPLSHQNNPKKENQVTEKKMTWKDKTNSWLEFWEWKKKENGIGIKGHPHTTGWYPTKQTINFTTYRTKILPAYWDGVNWKDSTDLACKPNTRVYAYVPTYSACREEAVQVCERFDTEVEVIRYD